MSSSIRYSGWRYQKSVFFFVLITIKCWRGFIHKRCLHYILYIKLISKTKGNASSRITSEVLLRILRRKSGNPYFKVSWKSTLTYRPISSDKQILKATDFSQPTYTQNVTCSFWKLIRSGDQLSSNQITIFYPKTNGSRHSSSAFMRR